MKIDQATTFDLSGLTPRKGSHTERFLKKLRRKQLTAEQCRVTIFEHFDSDLHSSTEEISLTPVPRHTTTNVNEHDQDSHKRVRAECLIKKPTTR